MEEGITVFTTVHVCGNGVLSPSDGGMFGLPRSFMKWQERGGESVMCLCACMLAVCGCVAAICSLGNLWKIRHIEYYGSVFSTNRLKLLLVLPCV